MQNTLNIAVIEFDIVWEQADANLLLLDEKLRQLATTTDLIILPETFNTGFSMHTKNAEKMNGKTVLWMLQKAKELNCAICGTLMIEEQGNYYNRALFVKPDSTIATYDKQHLFVLSDEYKILSPGTTNTIVEWKGWKIALYICFDLRFPVSSWNIQDNNQYKYDIAIYMANWPAVRNHHWEALLRARAIENRCYVVGVNRTGKAKDQIEYIGNSIILNFDGNIDQALSNPLFEASLDGTALNHFRKQFAIE